MHCPGLRHARDFLWGRVGSRRSWTSRPAYNSSMTFGSYAACLRRITAALEGLTPVVFIVRHWSVMLRLFICVMSHALLRRGMLSSS